MRYTIIQTGERSWQIRIQSESGKQIFVRAVESDKAPYAEAERVLKACKVLAHAAQAKLNQEAVYEYTRTNAA